MPATHSLDAWDQVADIVSLIRSGRAQTRPELADATRLGRNVITQRVQTAQDLGLVEPDGTGRSRGGRAADVWRFRGARGHILVGLVGVQAYRTYLTDLSGTVLASHEEEFPLTPDPESTCEHMADAFARLLAEHPDGELWGICIGLPAPVDFTTGHSIDPVATRTHLPRWHASFDVRTWFADRFHTPSWTDAVANLTTLGVAATGEGPQDLIVVRLGTGLGGGLVSNGRIHRGSAWLAGELAHVQVLGRDDADERICPCGRVGCLDTFASGWALAMDAEQAVREGRSPFLAARAEEGPLTADTVASGADYGDPTCIELIVGAAEALGLVLASATTWFNPGRIVIGGFPYAHNELFLNVVRRTIQLNTLATLVRGLDIVQGSADQRETLDGAVELVVNALTSASYLSEWGPFGSPSAAPELVRRSIQNNKIA